MPHRTTYFFPRQFPDNREFDPSSSKFFIDHEKKFNATTTNKDKDCSCSASKSTVHGNVTSFSSAKETATRAVGGGGRDKIHGFMGDKIHGKQLAAFVSWLAEKKRKEISVSSKYTPVRCKLEDLDDDDDEEHQHLLRQPQPPPEEAVQQRIIEVDHQPTGLDRLVSLDGLNNYNNECNGGKETGNGGLERPWSLQRLSSLGSTSYAGSLFSGGTTVCDGNWTSSSTGVKDSTTTRTRGMEETELEEERADKDSVVQKSKESYYLQLTLAKRITEQTTLASEIECGGAVSSDALTVSYALWVLFLFLIYFPTFCDDTLV